MTENEKKKTYLKSYRESVKREQEILEEIQRLRMDKMFPSVANDGMPKGGTQRPVGLHGDTGQADTGTEKGTA